MSATNSNFGDFAERFAYATDEDIKALFPYRLKTLREKIGVTQEEFAERLCISRQALSLYEKGSRVPDICIFSRILEVTGCSAYYLLGYQETMVDSLMVLSDATGLSDESCHKLFSQCRQNREAMELLISSEKYWRLIEYIGFALDGWTLGRSSAEFNDKYFRFKVHCMFDDLVSSAESIAFEKKRSPQNSRNLSYNSWLDSGLKYDEYRFDSHGELESRIKKNAAELERKQANKDAFAKEAEKLKNERLKEIEEDKFENFKARLHKFGPYRE